MLRISDITFSLVYLHLKIYEEQIESKGEIGEHDSCLLFELSFLLLVHHLRNTSGCFWSQQWPGNGPIIRYPVFTVWRIAVNQKRDTSFTSRSNSTRVIAARYRVVVFQPINHVNDFSYTSIKLAIMIAKCIARVPLEIYTAEIAIRNNRMIDAADEEDGTRREEKKTRDEISSPRRKHRELFAID